MSYLFLIFATILIAANAQRSPYAGSRPGSGYKDRFVTQSPGAGNAAGVDDRLGENGSNGVTTSTDRLPYDAYGDHAIVNYWNNVPVDQRPFWIVNQQHIENHRGTPPRPSIESSTGTSTAVPSPTTLNGADGVVNRFGERPIQQQPINQNAISQQEIVYPINITPEQKLAMQIQFTQQRLNALLEQQRKIEAQQGQNNQPNTQASSRRLQRNF